jgi:molybdopterin-guanine dinucleotide biosynthesis protein A/molybdopterin-guanine dinucleotide biosynthesis protein
MGGEDKGLLEFQGRAMIARVIDTLLPQVDSLIINANRHIDQYQQFGLPVIRDSLEGFQGPLAGMLSAMETCDADYILTAPCDSPRLSSRLRQRLLETLLQSGGDIAVANDGKRMQPVFSLIPTRLKADLRDYLAQGERKVDRWLSRFKLVEVSFADEADSFANINQPGDLQTLQHVTAPLPMLGLSAFSGTGKTTLLTQLLPLLNQRGISVGVIKHAHHKFDIDKPGKDSYEIREAGAQQILIASSRMMALVEKKHGKEQDPQLCELITRLDMSKIQLILVEGFKHENFAKLELHRPALGQPLLFPDDPNIIAIASDAPIQNSGNLICLDINNAATIADFIEQFIQSWKA